MKYAPREAVLKVYEALEEGKTYAQAAREVGCTREQAARWHKNPERYTPYIDEVAVDRAAAGDKAVYEALSVYEMIEFWKLVEKRVAQSDKERIDGCVQNIYLNRLAPALGITGDRLSDLRIAATRMRERIAAAPPITPGKMAKVFLTDDAVRGIRKDYAWGKTTLEQVGQKYGVSKATVSRIISRKRWAHVV